jgi:hypothetical protein
MGLLLALLSAPRLARANSGNSFLETIGISIAVGTVLGASTLPFYRQPGTHLINVGYGASAGAVAAIGVSIYGLFQGRSHDPYDDVALWRHENRGFALGPPPGSIWMPVVSVNW